MNQHVSFLFTSLLTDDCIARGKALLDGGVRYLGGQTRRMAISALPDSVVIRDWSIKNTRYGN